MAKKAGFERAKMKIGAGATCYATPEERRWWATVNMDRLEKNGDYRRNTLNSGTSEETIAEILTALRQWEKEEDGWYAILQCENIYWK